MIKIISERLDNKYKDFIKNQYYVRLIKNPEKYVGQPPHRFVNKEQAMVAKSEEEAKSIRKRFATRNNYNLDDFQIINGSDLYYEDNPDEEDIFTEAINDEEITIYRGILADNRKEADRYIKSTKTLGAQDFGKGMYWTQSEDTAKNYGNYIYKATINKSDAKKVLDAQDIVLLSKDFHKTLSPECIAQLDLGPSAQYTFYPKLWKDTEMVKHIQNQYKNYIERTNGKFLENDN